MNMNDSRISSDDYSHEIFYPPPPPKKKGAKEYYISELKFRIPETPGKDCF